MKSITFFSFQQKRFLFYSNSHSKIEKDQLYIRMQSECFMTSCHIKYTNDLINITPQIEHICQFLYKFVHFITKAIFGSVGNLAPDFFVFFGVFNKTTAIKWENRRKAKRKLCK